MAVEERSWFSPALGHDMALRVHGHAGRPIVAFPSLNGRYTDFEGFGMIEAVGGFIDAGRIRVLTIDGVDWQSWSNHGVGPADRANRHQAYDRYVADEVVPFIRDHLGGTTAWAVGCSMGAFHAANALFRHPDLFDGLIAMSGLYSARRFVGDHVDDAIYFNSPLLYLPGLEDPGYLDRLRAARIAIVVGQGAWEDDMIVDTRALGAVLAAKGIPAIVDFWGQDVNHDWPWWRQMLPHYLERLEA